MFATPLMSSSSLIGFYPMWLPPVIGAIMALVLGSWNRLSPLHISTQIQLGRAFAIYGKNKRAASACLIIVHVASNVWNIMQSAAATSTADDNDGSSSSGGRNSAAAPTVCLAILLIDIWVMMHVIGNRLLLRQHHRLISIQIANICMLVATLAMCEIWMRLDFSGNVSEVPTLHWRMQHYPVVYIVCTTVIWTTLAAYWILITSHIPHVALALTAFVIVHDAMELGSMRTILHFALTRLRRLLPIEIIEHVHALIGLDNDDDDDDGGGAHQRLPAADQQLRHRHHHHHDDAEEEDDSDDLMIMTRVVDNHALCGARDMVCAATDNVDDDTTNNTISSQLQLLNCDRISIREASLLQVYTIGIAVARPIVRHLYNRRQQQQQSPPPPPLCSICHCNLFSSDLYECVAAAEPAAAAAVADDNVVVSNSTEEAEEMALSTPIIRRRRSSVVRSITPFVDVEDLDDFDDFTDDNNDTNCSSSSSSNEMMMMMFLHKQHRYTDDTTSSPFLNDCEFAVKMIKCRHMFHRHCIVGWMRTAQPGGQPKGCPLCRSHIDESYHEWRVPRGNSDGDGDGDDD
jgi:hypothetical protein